MMKFKLADLTLISVKHAFNSAHLAYVNNFSQEMNSGNEKISLPINEILNLLHLFTFKINMQTINLTQGILVNDPGKTQDGKTCER